MQLYLHNTLCSRQKRGICTYRAMPFFIFIILSMVVSKAQEQQILHTLFSCYESMKIGKTNKISIIEFDMHKEQEIMKLYHELITNTYVLSPYTCFLIYDPIPREIFAPHVRDRIVHHFIYREIEPILEQLFLKNSYACRKWKWTHYGVFDIKKMMRSASDNYTKEARICKNDIFSFFMSINKDILFALIEDILWNNEAMLTYPKDRLSTIIKTIIYHDPTSNYVRIGKHIDRKSFPPHKSLFASKPWTGLPLGNLTSQLFANIYLHELDIFITKTLGIEHYGRYMDDFVMIHTDKTFLLDSIQKIKIFLEEKLKLILHPHKKYFQPIHHGVLFCWVHIKPYYMIPRTRTIGRWKKKIYEWIHSPPKSYSQREQFRSTINSYLGMMKHWHSYRLRKNMLWLLPTSRHNHIYFKQPFDKIMLKLKKIKKKYTQTLFILYKLFWW